MISQERFNLSQNKFENKNLPEIVQCQHDILGFDVEGNISLEKVSSRIQQEVDHFCFYLKSGMPL